MRINKQLQKELCTAVSEGDLPRAIRALDAGANPNAPYERTTPLQYACAAAHADMVWLLHSRGADLNHTNEDGEYCFSYIPDVPPTITDKQRAETIKNLLMLGMDKDAFSHDGPVSFWCARHLNGDDLRLVLQMGLSLVSSEMDEESINIAHCLAFNTKLGVGGVIYALGVFEKAGIDIHQPSLDGNTPKQYASFMNNETFIEAFDQFAALKTRVVLENSVAANKPAKRASKI